MSDFADEPRRPILGGGERLARAAERVTGGGPKYAPRSFDEARELLLPMVARTLTAARELPERLRAERIYVEATLLPNYLAASHHPSSLEEEADLVVVGTRPATGTLRRPRSVEEDAATKTLVFAATERSLERLDTLLREPGVPSSGGDIAKFDRIELPPASHVLLSIDRQRLATESAPVWEAVLQPPIDASGRLSGRVLELVLARWDALVRSLEGEVHTDYVRRVGDLTFTPVTLAADKLDAVAAFNPLRSIKPMPRLRPIRPRFRAFDFGAATPTPPAGGPPADARVAVFDGGVDATHPLLAPYVTDNDLTGEPEEADAVSHGTLVASALLYGHIQTGRPLEPPPAHVDMFRVHPVPWTVPPEDEAYWVLDQVEDVLRRAPKRWKIVNLSYGPDVPLDELAEVDRFTAGLDQLANDLGITITVAVGNEGTDSISSLGEDRVQAPADGVNVIGVGSCTDLHPPEPVRAPYSCVGPGRPGLRVQPLGVSFGGSDAQLFVGADRNGTFQADMGTSFAAPLAAHGLATLIGETPFSANIGRGFAAHFATPPTQQALRELGYGRFRESYRDVLSCGDGEITVVIDDEIGRGETRAYPLPFPADGLPSGRVRLRWTASFTSPVDPADPVDYTSAGLEVVFRPNAALFSMRPPSGVGSPARDIDLRSDGALLQNLANENWTLSTNPKARSGSAIRSEQTLRDEGKWETVVRHEDGILSKGLHLPELWVTYFERERGRLVPQSAARRLRFSLLMTVRAPSVPDLYDRVLTDSRFAALTPLSTLAVVRTTSA